MYALVGSCFVLGTGLTELRANSKEKERHRKPNDAMLDVSAYIYIIHICSDYAGMGIHISYTMVYHILNGFCARSKLCFKSNAPLARIYANCVSITAHVNQPKNIKAVYYWEMLSHL